MGSGWIGEGDSTMWKIIQEENEMEKLGGNRR